jgi:hypothetical protein
MRPLILLSTQIETGILCATYVVAQCLTPHSNTAEATPRAAGSLFRTHRLYSDLNCQTPKVSYNEAVTFKIATRCTPSTGGPAPPPSPRTACDYHALAAVEHASATHAVPERRCQQVRVRTGASEPVDLLLLQLPSWLQL